MGRKNGKTTTISGVANYAVSQDGENGAEIHLLANVLNKLGFYLMNLRR